MVDDIELRHTKTTRLVFRPLIVDNAQEREAAVKGSFIFQRKRLKNEWEDLRTLNLSQLKADEWIKLELKSSEILRLYQELTALYEVFEKEGIPSGRLEYIRATAELDALLSATDEELEAVLQEKGEEASETLAKLLHWSLTSSDIEAVLASLEQLEIEDLQELSSLIGLRTLKTSLEIWEGNKDNSDEEFWQRTLGEYAFVLSQVFSYPIIVLKDKAYVGGKSVENLGGSIVDFLLQNNVSQNVILAEIKTPVTPLLGPLYRGVYNTSSDITGAVIQISNYRHSLITEYFSLSGPGAPNFTAFEPQCIVVAGNHIAQLEDETKRRSFELFRSQLRYVQLITYDELFGKVKLLLDLLEGDGFVPGGGDAESNRPEEDEIPF